MSDKSDVSDKVNESGELQRFSLLYEGGTRPRELTLRAIATRSSGPSASQKHYDDSNGDSDLPRPKNMTRSDIFGARKIARQSNNLSEQD